MATHCETVMIGSVRGPTAVESVPVMNGKRAVVKGHRSLSSFGGETSHRWNVPAPKLPNAALQEDRTQAGVGQREYADVGTSVWRYDLHDGKGNEMDLRREQVPRDGDVGGVDGAIHEADHRGGDGVLDARGHEPDEEVHTECDGCRGLLSVTGSRLHESGTSGSLTTIQIKAGRGMSLRSVCAGKRNRR